MNKEFIIGREGNQPFPIPHKGLPSSSDSVHRQHAKITIDEYGNWTLEDLKGSDGNGTFIRDENGIFKRVYKTRIGEDTVIRLGNGGQHSFIFMAHHVLATNPEDYSFEFRKVKDCFTKITDESNILQEKINKQNKSSRYLSPLLGFVLSIIPSLFVLDPKVDWILTRLCFLIAPVLIGLIYSNSNNGLKKIKDKAERLFVCPKCQRPISKHDINNQLCPVCKAH